MARHSAQHLSATIGANLRTARLAAGLTQREMGEAIGVEGVFISRWERGRHSPSPVYIQALANELFDGDVSAMYREIKEAV